MFVICRKGHLAYYWNGNSTIFIESESAILPSRRECLEYLQKCGHTKERAVEIIKLIQGKPETWSSV